ncbi:hypothetical protein DBV39_09915 [Orrella marina]|uniref:Uncharacterized protein n=1 Tax=Orrella marina TaxID=2163011 RepID=A0A2R4XJK0_9BURK|nr:hypothetical protein DBV39_09915 [Orrella marina]
MKMWVAIIDMKGTKSWRTKVLRKRFLNDFTKRDEIISFKKIRKSDLQMQHLPSSAIGLFIHCRPKLTLLRQFQRVNRWQRNVFGNMEIDNSYSGPLLCIN